MCCMTLQTLGKMSPTSLKLTFEQLRRGKQLDLKGCLRMVRTSVLLPSSALKLSDCCCAML